MKQNRTRLLVHAASMAAGIAAALVGIAAVRGNAFILSAPKPPTGYVGARADGFVLYAPNPTALREGAEDIEFARRAFHRDFGAEPREVIVVLADSPAAFRSIDLADLRRPGTAFLPFVTRSRVAFESPADEMVALDGGALLQAADGVLRFVAAGRGGGRDAGLMAGDELVALNGIPATARDSLIRGFDAIPTGERVRLDIRRAGRPIQLDYPKGVKIAGAAQIHVQAAARFRAESKTLAHEVCHQLVASHAARSMGRRTPPARGYGHPGLPDWVDEMAATLCESPASRDRRRAYLRANLRERIPLAELTQMEHPVSVAVRARSAGSPLPDTLGGSPVVMLRGEAARELLRSMNAPMFYSQALSLGEFILQRGGPRALREITEDLARGRTLDQALGRAGKHAPRLPASVAEMEREWVRWVEASQGP
jgi:hypothetical protein